MVVGSTTYSVPVVLDGLLAGELMREKIPGHAFVLNHEKEQKAAAKERELRVSERVLSIAALKFEDNRKAMAKALNVPYHRISNIARGNAVPSLDLILKCVETFGVTLEYIFGLTDHPYRADKAVLLKVYQTDKPKKVCDQFEVTGALLGIDYMKPESSYMAYRVMDDTNAPEIPPESTVVVDMDTPPGDYRGIWAISLAGEIQLRLIVPDIRSQTVSLSCYNKAHKLDAILDTKKVKFIGRVIWISKRLYV